MTSRTDRLPRAYIFTSAYSIKASEYVAFMPASIFGWLFMEIRVLLYQQVDERGQERLSSFSDVVNKLKKPEVKRQFVL